MEFAVPGAQLRFAIPDEWWRFCDMQTFRPSTHFYLYAPGFDNAATVPITEIEPPVREAGIPSFRKYKLVPVLLAFTSPERVLPAVRAERLDTAGRYRYRVLNGYHRFYASVAVGYSSLPVVL